MARPLTATDDEIIAAAQQVLARGVSEPFTLSAVARELGLTRTAIAFRVGSAAELKLLVMKRAVRTFRTDVQAQQITCDASGLLAVADMIATHVDGRDGLTNFVLTLMTGSDDPAFAEMIESRGGLLREMLAEAMPETTIGVSAAIDAFMSHIIGTLINWQATDGIELRHFMRARTLAWIRLAGIAVDEPGV